MDDEIDDFSRPDTGKRQTDRKTDRQTTGKTFTSLAEVITTLLRNATEAICPALHTLSPSLKTAVDSIISGSDQHHPAPLWRFCDFGAVCKCLTYFNSS